MAESPCPYNAREGIWWRKVKRAQFHLREIHLEAQRYAAEEPYRVVRVIRRSKKKGNQWIYRLEMTSEPSPMLNIVIGEFLYCLRSALDNVVVACAPRANRANVSFPVDFQNIWAIDESGEYVIRDDDARKRFTSMTDGLPDGVVAIVKTLQPYHLGRDGMLSAIGVISRLNNADKHRGVLTHGPGGIGSHLIVSARGLTTLIQFTPVGNFAEDGTEFPPFTLPYDPPLRPSEVNVQLHASAVIAIQVPGAGSGKPSPMKLFGLVNCLNETRSALRQIEPYALA